MDRRRKLFILLLVVLTVAVLDMRANGVNFVDDWGRLFDIRTEGMGPGNPGAFAQATATYTASHPAVEVDTFILNAGVGHVTIVGADTDAVTVETQIHTLADAVHNARAYADGFQVSLERTGPTTLQASWQAPPRSDNLRLAQMTWVVTVPRDVTVSVQEAHGFVNIRNTAGPLHVDARSGFVLDIAPAAPAPIYVRSFGGEVRLFLGATAMNYDVDGTVRLGSFRSIHPPDSPLRMLQRTRNGAITHVTGVLGEGEHPLVFDVQGDVRIYELRE